MWGIEVKRNDKEVILSPITLPHIAFLKGPSHILSSKIKQIFGGHMDLKEKVSIL